jgi:site-specific DNA recombinase
MISSVATQLKRVAIYTRKSVTEGLDQEFNTLDAQREAVEAYVVSQRGSGWEAIPNTYDDGGFTGSNTDRPAFKRLMADVAAGVVDVVAVYKLDRLSRSLADFARLMEVFERYGVTFVSVTQQFNSTSSMGRFTLNILMSFAEFEREMIAERTSDKMQAARRRGLWTGGRPILGYDAIDKKLVPNEAEAEQVRAIFTEYLNQPGIIGLVRELNERGMRNKTWTNKRDEVVHGGEFNKGTLHAMLSNPIYIGMVRAGENVVNGVHESIIPEALWDAVQTKLASKRNNSCRPRKPRRGALLQGLVRCNCGASITSHFSQKANRKYSYYVCSKQQNQGAESCPGSRIAAGKLESAVIDQIRSIGRDPKLFSAVIEADESSRDSYDAECKKLETKRNRLRAERTKLVDAIAEGTTGNGTLAERVGAINEELSALVEPDPPSKLDPESLRAALDEFDAIWSELFSAERARVLSLLIEEIQFDGATGDVEVTFRPS